MEINAVNSVRADKRRTRRFEIDARCRILTDDGSDVIADVHDISASGMGIRLAQSLMFGRRYMLAVEPICSTHSPRLNALGTVAHCELLGSAFRIGLKFVDIDPGSRLRLQALEKDIG